MNSETAKVDGAFLAEERPGLNDSQLNAEAKNYADYLQIPEGNERGLIVEAFKKGYRSVK